jgi:hypothetical protein
MTIKAYKLVSNEHRHLVCRPLNGGKLVTILKSNARCIGPNGLVIRHKNRHRRMDRPHLNDGGGVNIHMKGW